MRQVFGRSLRRFALWAMMVPFVLVSLIGPGVMPVRTETGALMLVICTEEGMIERAFDPVTMEPVSDSDQGGGELPGPEACHWASAHSAFTLNPLPALPQPMVLTSRRQVPDGDTTRMVAAATGLPPSTGPPVAL